MFVIPSILDVKRMSMITLGFSTGFSRASKLDSRSPQSPPSLRIPAALAIRAGADRFKMIRVNTIDNAAKMIQLKAIWNRSTEKLIGEAMCELIPISHLEATIPRPGTELPRTGKTASGPKPTPTNEWRNWAPISFIDVLPEVLFSVRSHG